MTLQSTWPSLAVCVLAFSFPSANSRCLWAGKINSHGEEEKKQEKVGKIEGGSGGWSKKRGRERKTKRKKGMK